MTKKATFHSLFEIMNIIDTNTILTKDETGNETLTGLTASDILRKSQEIKSMVCITMTCNLLKEQKLIIMQRQGRKKYVVLTEKGQNFLRRMQDLYHAGGMQLLR